MATINKQNPPVTGATVTFSAAATLGDSYTNQGHERTHFKNSSGAPIVVTVDAPNPDNFGVSGNSLDVTVTVPAGATNFIAGPFRPDRHNDANGKVQLTYSTEVGLSLAVIG